MDKVKSPNGGLVSDKLRALLRAHPDALVAVMKYGDAGDEFFLIRGAVPNQIANSVGASVTVCCAIANLQVVGKALLKGVKFNQPSFFITMLPAAEKISTEGDRL